MDHERVSELLAAFDRGQLQPAESEAVRAHLQDCAECSTELAGLRRLSGAAAAPLTDAERERIRRGIRAGIDQGATQEVIRPGRKPRWVRWAPALAGAATVAVIVAGVAMFGGGVGMDSAGDAGGAANERAPAADGADQSGAGGGQAGPAVYAGDLGDITSRSLRRDTKRRTLLGLPDRYDQLGYAAEATSGESNLEGASVEDAEEASGKSVRIARRVEANLAALQAQANLAIGEQIATCAASVAEEFGFPSVPVYAATATLEGERVLIVGFTWRTEPDSARREFMVWAWPIGDCRIPIFYGSSAAPK